jgi:hypothetical protein
MQLRISLLQLSNAIDWKQTVVYDMDVINCVVHNRALASPTNRNSMRKELPKFRGFDAHRFLVYIPRPLRSSCGTYNSSNGSIKPCYHTYQQYLTCFPRDMDHKQEKMSH